VKKYLLQYAEPEIAALEGLPASLAEPGQWHNVMVIPACNENAAFLRPPPSCGGRSLMILVINESISASAEVSKANQALADVVGENFELLWQSGQQAPGYALSLFRDPLHQRDVLLVDRFSEACKLPHKGGVGQARKIGVDLASSLIYRKLIGSVWIHCTDADVQLPETYFTYSSGLQYNSAKCAALIYPFHHCDFQAEAANSEVLLSTQLYELSLRYYVAGMKFARSPYAFHTIGSTMAVNAEHYARVRGFPRRAAGEDFYLLNKLAKVGSVLEAVPGTDCEPILIQSRSSDRVPFGTGAAVNKITSLTDPVKEFRFYHPVVFELLRLWLQSLATIWQSRSCELSEDVFVQQTSDPDQVHKRQSLLDALRKMKTEQALEHAFRQSKNLDQFKRQMHTWFDAFRTLKLIHALRDSLQANITYATLEADSIYRHLLEHDADLSAYAAKLPFAFECVEKLAKTRK
jgi:hypothetical protein